MKSEVYRRCTGSIASDAVLMWSASVPRRADYVRIHRLRYARPATAATAQRSVWSRRTAAASDEDAATNDS